MEFSRPTSRPCERRDPYCEDSRYGTWRRPFFTFEARGYGSLRSQGRPSHTIALLEIGSRVMKRFIDFIPGCPMKSPAGFSESGRALTRRLGSLICPSGLVELRGTRNDVGEHRSPDGAQRNPGFTRRRSRIALRFIRAAAVICPTGYFVSSARTKNISLPSLVETALLIPSSRPTEGRIAIVTDAGRDAVDAAASGVKRDAGRVRQGSVSDQTAR
jgi:hypothetical protein